MWNYHLYETAYKLQSISNKRSKWQLIPCIISKIYSYGCHPNPSSPPMDLFYPGVSSSQHQYLNSVKWNLPLFNCKVEHNYDGWMELYVFLGIYIKTRKPQHIFSCWCHKLLRMCSACKAMDILASNFFTRHKDDFGNIICHFLFSY